jgi:hypothetical protein
MSIGYSWLGRSRKATEYGDRREWVLNGRLAGIQVGTKNDLERRKFLIALRQGALFPHWAPHRPHDGE